VSPIAESEEQAAMPSRRRSLAGILLAGAGAFLAGCTAVSNYFPQSQPPGGGAPAGQPSPGATIGTGDVKAALILPLTAPGNASAAGQAMRNAAELALDEAKSSNLQLLVKDDGGNPEAARLAAEQAMTEGAQIILGPLFAQSVSSVGQAARARNIPVIAFSTDTNVASRGIYLLSFLPETDVERIVQHAASSGKRAYAALIPDNPYGTVVEAAFRQDVARRGGQVVALERYAHEKAAMAGPAKNIAQVAARLDALFLPDSGDAVPDLAQMLVSNGLNTKKVQLLGTGLWDDPRILSSTALDGGEYAAPDAAGYRSFVNRYTGRFKQQPVRTATLAYDAVALIAALVKTHQQFTPETLTNPSGFSGIDGLFRFRADGTNDRGLAVLRVTTTGVQVVSPPPKSFGA
jgi:branched-chain amino acid transport system substrate-binding protein